MMTNGRNWLKFKSFVHYLQTKKYLNIWREDLIKQADKNPYDRTCYVTWYGSKDAQQNQWYLLTVKSSGKILEGFVANTPELQELLPLLEKFPDKYFNISL